MARLSTHVLDTERGGPAVGVGLTLCLLSANGRTELARAVTNADGRTDAPLLSGETIPVGVYELTFAAGAYLRASGRTLPDPAFLDEVVIRFGVGDAAEHYHVPLLLSSHGYSTYRGS